MNIKTKFNIKDVVWISAFKKVKHICGFCSGKGKIIGDNESTTHCPICRGEKYITDASKYIPIKCFVDEIELTITIYGQTVFYNVRDKEYQEHNSYKYSVFDNEEDCFIECVSRNEKLDNE